VGNVCFMPIFEYECLKCEQQFEHLERASSPKAACPSCGADQVQRLVSLCAVSSESSRAASLSTAHQRAAAKRQEKQRSEHTLHHDHFGDAAHK
jgi:putative FmdB family regulatory protein